MNPPRILVVDDDANICEVLRLYMEHEGYSLVFAANGSEALNKFNAENPDLVILDIMLPVINGMEVCKLIRTRSRCPILMITAKDTVDDKVQGLETGADDYVVKPFDPKEVVARVKALLRRTDNNAIDNGHRDTFSIGGLEINLTRYEVFMNGRRVDLKPKEIQLLHFLCLNRNHVFTREQLLEKVWGYDFYGETRTVDVHVKRLREKLETPEAGWRIATVWGVGYKLEVD